MSGGFWCFSCSCWPLSHRRWAFSEKLAQMASAKRNIVVLVWDQKKIKDLAWTGVAGTYFCDFLWVNDGTWWPHEGVIADFSSVFSPLSPGWDCFSLRQGQWPSCWALHGCRGGDIPIRGMNIWLQDQKGTTTFSCISRNIGLSYIHWWSKYVYIYNIYIYIIYPTESRSTNIEQYILYIYIYGMLSMQPLNHISTI